MEITKNLIIFSLFSLSLISMGNGKYCAPSSCSYSGTSIMYPFHIKGRKPDSCGVAGFDVYCDDKSGKAVLELPSAGNFSIEHIYQYLYQIELTDPEDCLPRKLMLLDLNNISPFQTLGPLSYFKLYNCSQSYFDYFDYDKIDCLSESGYTVVSTGIDTTFFTSNPHCTFLKALSAPSGFSFYSLSRIFLTWNETSTKCLSCDDYPSRTNDLGIGTILALGLVLGIPAAIMVCICVSFHCCKQRMNEPGNNNTNRTSGLQMQSRPVTLTGGLDQAIIDLYPVVVIGQSGRLIKPDDDTCPICLSDYAPYEMLKMLPECLHRFHADCIDQWLRAKGVCPICRITLPRS